jgi:hypothetical protein
MNRGRWSGEKSREGGLSVPSVWWMRESKCEGRFQCANIGADEWHCSDMSVTVGLESDGNMTDQEAE